MTLRIITKTALEKREKKLLAPYAVLSSKTAGRAFPETADSTRTEFQRDRDRIIHSKAFRRLSGKTQVFVATYGDHFRDRLSHSLEVAQVARDLARSLGLNEDLVEAIALAHDLGHTPFGHAGEAALNEIMEKFGSRFEHNEQSKRIVEQIEKQFPAFDGLNLTYEVRQGLAKHQTLYDQRTKKITGKTLEAQVVDSADEIAYHNHDLDDGLRSRLFSLRDLEKLSLWRDALAAVYKKYPAYRRAGGRTLAPRILKSRVISSLISLMIQDVLRTTAKVIKRNKIRTRADVLRQKKNCVGFSQKFGKKIVQLRNFLWKRMYQSAAVIKLSRRGQKILQTLFWHFYRRPRLLPRRFYERIKDGAPLHEIVRDYSAGMTDQFATDLYEKL